MTSDDTLQILLLATGGTFHLKLANVAAILGIDPQTIHNQLSKGTFPLKPVNARGEHKRVHFDVRDVAVHLDSTRVQNLQVVLQKRKPGRPPKRTVQHGPYAQLFKQ